MYIYVFSVCIYMYLVYVCICIYCMYIYTIIQYKCRILAISVVCRIFNISSITKEMISSIYNIRANIVIFIILRHGIIMTVLQHSPRPRPRAPEPPTAKTLTPADLLVRLLRRAAKCVGASRRPARVVRAN